MGEKVGYCRVSSRDQNLTIQRDKLKAAGCTKIFSEKKSGLDGERAELKRCIEYLRDGDMLVVTKADRLGRSTGHLLKTIEDLKARGVGVVFLDQPELSSNTKYGALMLTILAGIAQFETALRAERQAEGIERALKDGVKFGRELLLTPDVVADIKTMRKDGALIKDIMAKTELSKASVYRALGPAG